MDSLLTKDFGPYRLVVPDEVRVPETPEGQPTYRIRPFSEMWPEPVARRRVPLSAPDPRFEFVEEFLEKQTTVPAIIDKAWVFTASDPRVGDRVRRLVDTPDGRYKAGSVRAISRVDSSHVWLDGARAAAIANRGKTWELLGTLRTGDRVVLTGKHWGARLGNSYRVTMVIDGCFWVSDGSPHPLSTLSVEGIDWIRCAL